MGKALSLSVCAVGVLLGCEPPEVEPPVELCGNGTLELDEGEDCDDGNPNDGDGCSALCLVEEGHAFEGAPEDQGGIPATFFGDNTPVLIHAALPPSLADSYNFTNGTPFFATLTIHVLGGEAPGICPSDFDVTITSDDSGQSVSNIRSSSFGVCAEVLFQVAPTESVTVEIERSAQPDRVVKYLVDASLR